MAVAAPAKTGHRIEQTDPAKTGHRIDQTELSKTGHRIEQTELSKTLWSMIPSTAMQRLRPKEPTPQANQIEEAPSRIA
jgi:hypothetical protein